MKKLFWHLFLLLIGGFITTSSFCQRILPQNAYNIHRQLKQLNNLTTVLYLAAHPDDENTRLLSYLVHERNFRTYYLSLTRGEGGQNLIGQELGLDLGLIRNYELLAARDIDGAKQLFTSTIDFGFSKTPEETFSFWNKEKIILETIDIIQHIRPDVIICRFPTTGEGGHGQHTASAIIALESFNRIIKNPNYFQPERLLFNAFRFGDRNTIKDSHFPLLTQQYNPGLGQTYGQLAGISRSIHRSQGAGTPQSIGVQYEYFELMAGNPIENDIIDRNISWERVNASHIGHQINQIIASFDFTKPELSIPALEEVKKLIEKDVKDTYWKKVKLEEIDAIILSCAGLYIEALSNRPEATYNQTINIKFNAHSVIPNTNIIDVKWNGHSVFNSISLEKDVKSENDLKIILPNNLPITQPFWREKSASSAHYAYDSKYSLDNKIINFPTLECTVKINNQTYILQVPIAYKYLHPTRGDVTEYFRITPPMVINPTQEILFIKSNTNNIIECKLKAYEAYNAFTIQIRNDKNEIIQTELLNAITPFKDTLCQIILKHPEKAGNKITLHILNGKDVYSLSQKYIKYDHLPELVTYNEASIKIVQPEWTLPNQHIAYIHGAGDKIPETLKNIGLNVDILPSESLNKLDILKNYQTIILGIRAYNTIENIEMYMDVLMRYVNDGGRLIVQYNTNNNLFTKKLGPYPFQLSRDRVTEEDAPIKILNANDPILNHPHKITSKDFEHWVQERGLYFPNNLSSEYTTVFEMNDKNEAPLNASLIYAKYGKGVFIYTGISFFRQIPAGVPGAIKLFLNCIELH